VQAEIITIGDEILIGQVADTNSAWLAQRLGRQGIRVGRMVSVGDTQEAIVQAIGEASRRAGLVILTGGLGPTHDDITRDALCAYFDTPCVFDPEAYRMIEEKFRRRGMEPGPFNRRQAELPASCKPLYNRLGTAPGMWFEENGVVYVSLPGVPHEMKALVEEQVLPALRGKADLPAVCQRTVLTAGLGESVLAEKVEAWRRSLPEGVGLAFLPSPGIVRMRLTALHDDPALTQAIDAAIEALQPVVGTYIYGYDDETLESAVGKLLRQRKSTVAVAESCTGGFLSHLLTTVPGSSDYFLGSVVAYDNSIKTNVLGVPAETVEAHGAVSEAVALAMAAGVRKLFKARHALATTGIAGPGGATPGKPVGTVWVAGDSEEGAFARRLDLSEHRLYNIRASSMYALNRLRMALQAGGNG
jgi:nicotinamide-nucleotide amidase